MKKILLVSLLFSLVAFCAGPEYELTFPEAANPQEPLFAAVQLEAEMMSNLGGHNEWLRVRDKNGNTVPWRLEQANFAYYEQIVENVPIKISSLLTMGSGALELIFSIEPTISLPQQATLVFQTQMKNFQQQIDVYGKKPLEDGKTAWLLLLHDGTIFDSSANLNIRNIEVDFTPCDLHEFRVVIQNASLEKTDEFHKILKSTDANGGTATEDAYTLNIVPFKLDGVKLKIQKMATEPVLRPRWQTVQAPFKKIESGKKGVSRYEVQPPLCPVTALYIEGNEANFSRRVNVYRSTKVMSKLASEPLVCIAMGAKKVTNNRISLAWNDTSPFVIEFEDNDNPEFSLKSITLETPLNELFFVMDSARAPYAIFVEPNGTMPKYDTVHLIESRNQTATRIKAGAFSGERIAPTIYPNKVRDRNITHIMMMTAILLVTIILIACVVLTVRKLG